MSLSVLKAMRRRFLKGEKLASLPVQQATKSRADRQPQDRQGALLMMIIGVYATLGVFLLIASRDSYAHKSLIWFPVRSSLVHGAIMGNPR
jgi:hypothetical protein